MRAYYRRPFPGARKRVPPRSATKQLLNHETDFPTRTPEARPQTRLSRPHENKKRPAHYQGTSRTRPSAPGGSVSYLIIAADPLVNGGPLSRHQRIRASADFARALSRGTRLPGGLFNVYVYPNSLDTARVGLAVSRRVSTRAVVRNLIKRIVREHFRTACATLPPVDIVFNARPAAATRSRAELAGTVQNILERVRTLAPTSEQL